MPPREPGSDREREQGRERERREDVGPRRDDDPIVDPDGDDPAVGDPIAGVDVLPTRTLAFLVTSAAVATGLTALVWTLALGDDAVPAVAVAVARAGLSAGSILAAAYAVGVVVAYLFVYRGGWDRLRDRLG
jgi:hypothetical protein